MKRIIIILLSVLLVMISGCNENDNPENWRTIKEEEIKILDMPDKLISSVTIIGPNEMGVPCIDTDDLDGIVILKEDEFNVVSKVKYGNVEFELYEGNELKAVSYVVFDRNEGLANGDELNLSITKSLNNYLIRYGYRIEGEVITVNNLKKKIMNEEDVSDTFSDSMKNTLNNLSQELSDECHSNSFTLSGAYLVKTDDENTLLLIDAADKTEVDDLGFYENGGIRNFVIEFNNAYEEDGYIKYTDYSISDECYRGSEKYINDNYYKYDIIKVG